MDDPETRHEHYFEFQTVHTNAFGETVNGRIWSLRAKSAEEVAEWRESIEMCQNIGGKDFYDKSKVPETDQVESPVRIRIMFVLVLLALTCRMLSRAVCSHVPYCLPPGRQGGYGSYIVPSMPAECRGGSELVGSVCRPCARRAAADRAGSTAGKQDLPRKESRGLYTGCLLFCCCARGETIHPRAWRDQLASRSSCKHRSEEVWGGD